MKTSVIQNCCLSLIVIEQKIHEHIIYNEKAAAFKEQFDRCVDIVLDLNYQFGTTRQLCEQIENRQRRENQEESKLVERRGSIGDSHMEESSLLELQSIRKDYMEAESEADIV